MRMLARSALWCFLLTATWSVAQMQVTLDHPVRRIEGVVQNEKGEPLPNIDVEVFGGRSLIGTAKSDSHGKFKTDSFEPGEYEVWFTYKPHPVFKDVIYKIRVNAKGSKEPIVITMPSL